MSQCDSSLEESFDKKDLLSKLADMQSAINSYRDQKSLDLHQTRIMKQSCSESNLTVVVEQFNDSKDQNLSSIKSTASHQGDDVSSHAATQRNFINQYLHTSTNIEIVEGGRMHGGSISGDDVIIAMPFEMVDQQVQCQDDFYLKEKAQMIENHQNQLQIFQDSLSSLKDQMGQLQKREQDYQDQIQNLEAEKTSYQEQLQKRTSSESVCMQETVELVQVVEDQTIELRERDTVIEQLRQNEVDMQEQIDELQGKLAEEFNKRRQSKSDWEDKLQEVNDDLNYYKDKYQEMKDLLSGCREQLKQFEDLNHMRNEVISQLEKDNKELRQGCNQGSPMVTPHKSDKSFSLHLQRVACSQAESRVMTAADQCQTTAKKGRFNPYQSYFKGKRDSDSQIVATTPQSKVVVHQEFDTVQGTCQWTPGRNHINPDQDATAQDNFYVLNSTGSINQYDQQRQKQGSLFSPPVQSPSYRGGLLDFQNHNTMIKEDSMEDFNSTSLAYQQQQQQLSNKENSKLINSAYSGGSIIPPPSPIHYHSTSFDNRSNPSATTATNTSNLQQKPFSQVRRAPFEYNSNAMTYYNMPQQNNNIPQFQHSQESTHPKSDLDYTCNFPQHTFQQQHQISQHNYHSSHDEHPNSSPTKQSQISFNLNQKRHNDRLLQYQTQVDRTRENSELSADLSQLQNPNDSKLSEDSSKHRSKLSIRDEIKKLHNNINSLRQKMNVRQKSTNPQQQFFTPISSHRNTPVGSDLNRLPRHMDFCLNSSRDNHAL